MEQAAADHEFLRRLLDVQDAAARGHPLGVAVGDQAAAAVGVLVPERAVDDVGDGLEPAVRVPRGALGLTRGVVDLAHLVHVHERVEPRQVHPGEGAPDREPLALVAGRRGGDRGDLPLGLGDVGLRDPRQHEYVVDGDRWHGFLLRLSASITMLERSNIPNGPWLRAPAPLLVTMGSVAFPAWIPTRARVWTRSASRTCSPGRCVPGWPGPRSGPRMVTHITGLASGYFATMMHIPPGPPLALTTDGVGTKILLAREANRWEPIGIDCVANNVNDVICTGAVPLALLDYMATDRIDAGVLEAVARGLYLGAEEAGIAIPGGEIAQIGAMLAPSAGGPPMLDLVGTAVGALPPGRDPVDGSRVSAGDVILALPSSGLHSNGYSLARRALFETGGLSLDSQVPGTGQRLDDALLAPTRVYVRAAEALWEAGVTPRGLVHISGGGLLNLARLAADVSYELDALPPPPPVFALIAEAGRVPAATMYATFNMGTGFCVIVSPSEAQAAIDALKSAGEQPVVAGSVTGRPGRYVSIPSAGLVGRGDAFEAVRDTV